MGEDRHHYEPGHGLVVPSTDITGGYHAGELAHGTKVETGEECGYA